jgi:hypothetical protein
VVVVDDGGSVVVDDGGVVDGGDDGGKSSRGVVVDDEGGTVVPDVRGEVPGTNVSVVAGARAGFSNGHDGRSLVASVMNLRQMVAGKVPPVTWTPCTLFMYRVSVPG